MEKSVGRPNTCKGEKPVRTTYQMCPKTKKALAAFCRENGFFTSQVVNRAVMDYIENFNKGDSNVPTSI